MQIFKNLRFLSPLDIMLLRVLDIVFDHLAKIGQRFSRNQFGRKRVIDLWQNLLLNFAQRNGVVRFFACQFFDRKIRREFHDDETRFASLLSH